MKLVAYCRVSSISQEENTSLQSQETAITEFCNYRKHELVEVLREAKSGKDTNRKQYQKMLDMLPLVDGIVVTKLDRLGRNVVDLLRLVNEVLEPMGKALIILDLELDTSNPINKMILTMMAAMAEMERNLIKERCDRGRKAAKAEGKHIGGGESRYGYRYDARARKMVVNEDEQKVISWMAAKYSVDGWTLREICDELNSQKVPTKLKQGSLWTVTKISAIFRRMGKDKPVKARALAVVREGRLTLVNVSEEVKTAINRLTLEGCTQKQIAVELNRMGLKSIKGGSFDQAMVCRVRQVMKMTDDRSLVAF